MTDRRPLDELLASIRADNRWQPWALTLAECAVAIYLLLWVMPR